MSIEASGENERSKFVFNLPVVLNMFFFIFIYIINYI